MKQTQEVLKSLCVWVLLVGTVWCAGSGSLTRERHWAGTGHVSSGRDSGCGTKVGEFLRRRAGGSGSMWGMGEFGVEHRGR